MTSLWIDCPGPPITPADVSAVATREWDLAVVGGGMVGLLAALAARRMGLQVCLVEARRIGEGTTGHSTVKVTAGHGRVAADLATRHDDAAALAYLRANAEGFADLRMLAGSLAEDVGWVGAPHVVHASTPASVEALRTAARLSLAAGLAVEPCSPPSWSTGEAWSWPESALVQPVSLARAIGRALTALGVPIVENTAVTGVDDHGPMPRVHLAGGQGLRARDVVIASHAPIHDPDGQSLRAEYYRHAAIAAPVRVERVPSSYDLDGMSTRPVTLPDGRPGAVIVGASQRAGAVSADAWDRLQEWATAALRAEEPTHRWAAQDVRTFELMPVIGRTRRSPHVIVITGFNAWGFTNAAAAARALPSILTGDPHRGSDAATDVADGAGLTAGGVTAAASAGWWVTRSMVGDHVRSVQQGADLAPGQGRVVGGPLRPRAECRTPDGVRHCVSARCTHVGCLVRWNAVELSWDCPCHGSRFTPDGQLLEGPAHSPLEPLQP